LNGDRASIALRASIAVVALLAVGLAADWLISARTRTLRYVAPATVNRIELDLAAGSAEIVGGRGEGVSVERTDRYAFGHPAVERRSVAGGVLTLRSRCPRIIVGSCSASYRLTVPDDVAVAVRTGAGRVSLEGFRGDARIETGSGDVAVAAYCGESLQAQTGSGDIDVISACAPVALGLRTSSGSATALVPRGRYRITATSSSGKRRIRDVTPSASSPFAIDIESRSGGVTVAGGV
jgi:hypothetical protein